MNIIFWLIVCCVLWFLFVFCVGIIVGLRVIKKIKKHDDYNLEYPADFQ